MVKSTEKRILLIDDEKEFCSLVKKNLEIMGDFVVFIASDGKEGIKLAKKEIPDLILLDIHMPGMDGFEVLEKLKKDSETMDIPVAMLTVIKDQASKERASQLYVEAYIAKSIEPIDLKAKINKILSLRGVK